MLRGTDQGDSLFESLDFNRGLVQSDNNGQTESMGALWGPGTQEQENPSTIMSHKLQTWRKNNVKVPAAKAAEELDKLYASLPEMAAVDLTFQDMIDRHNAKQPLSPGAEAKDRAVAGSPTRIHGIDENSAKVNGHSIGNFVPNGGGCNSPPYSFRSSLHESHSDSQPSNGSILQAGSSRMVNADERSSQNKAARTNQVMHEGSYSPFTTPSSSFRKDRDFNVPGVDSSEDVLQVGGQSHEAGGELTSPAKFLELQLEEKRARMSSFHDIQPRPSLNFVPSNASRSPNRQMFDSQQVYDCSICSATNLSFKTNCVTCGKTFCLTCMNSKTKDAPNGRQCKDCINGSKAKTSRDRNYSWRDCWPFYGCFRVQNVEWR